MCKLKNNKSSYKTIRSILIFSMVFITMLVSKQADAQMKIGDNASVIHPDAILELQVSNKGLLLPRVALTSTTSPAPLGSFVNGMVVFDTVTVNDVTPGIYYCDGTKWLRLSTSTTSTGGWSLTGNAGTNPATDYIGTTDNNPLVVRTNGSERMRVSQNGNIGIGTNNPAATLDVQGSVVIGTLTTGNIATDSVLVVDPSSGLVKKVSLAQTTLTVQKSLVVVNTNGQDIFNTPASITSLNKIMVYRNGVSISFTQNSATSIKAEIPSVPGDEIKIVQFL